MLITDGFDWSFREWTEKSIEEVIRRTYEKMVPLINPEGYEWGPYTPWNARFSYRQNGFYLRIFPNKFTHWVNQWNGTDGSWYPIFTFPLGIFSVDTIDFDMQDLDGKYSEDGKLQLKVENCKFQNSSGTDYFYYKCLVGYFDMTGAPIYSRFGEDYYQISSLVPYNGYYFKLFNYNFIRNQTIVIPWGTGTKTLQASQIAKVKYSMKCKIFTNFENHHALLDLNDCDYYTSYDLQITEDPYGNVPWEWNADLVNDTWRDRIYYNGTGYVGNDVYTPIIIIMPWSVDLVSDIFHILPGGGGYGGGYGDVNPITDQNDFRFSSQALFRDNTVFNTYNLVDEVVLSKGVRNYSAMGQSSTSEFLVFQLAYLTGQQTPITPSPVEIKFGNWSP